MMGGSGSGSRLREDAMEIWRSAVDAVRGDVAVEAKVKFDGQTLAVGGWEIGRDEFDSILLVGTGKATAAMAAGFLRAIGDSIDVRGRINVPGGTAEGLDLGRIEVCEARDPGVNEPTERAWSGTEASLRDVATAPQRELVVVLLSGGGSAMWVAPVEGVSWNDKLAVTRHLSASGASIGELNTVRKRLSRIKGGGLRRVRRAGPMVTLVLSDVIGDPLDTIASGPTVPDLRKPGMALEVLEKFDPQRALPASVYAAVSRPPAEFVWPDDPYRDVVTIGNNPAATAAAAATARRLGYHVSTHDATGQEGTAEEVGVRLADETIDVLHGCGGAMSHPTCLISGGEPVVRLVDAARRGKGGRNQQLVLAAMIRLASSRDFDAYDMQRLLFLSGGTDGEDGPTDAAGAILTEGVWDEAQRQGLDPADYLGRNDAYHFFAKTGGLLLTGPTGTNVGDVRIVLAR